MRKFILAAAIAAICFVPCTAHAGLFSSLLSFDGTEDIIEDDSVGNMVEIVGNTTDGILEVGDIIQGMIAFDDVDTNEVPDGSSVIGLYSFEVLGIGSGGSSLSLGAASGVHNVMSILTTAGVDTSSLVSTGTGFTEGLVLLETTNGDFGRNEFEGPGFGFTAASGGMGQ